MDQVNLVSSSMFSKRIRNDSMGNMGQSQFHMPPVSKVATEPGFLDAIKNLLANQGVRLVETASANNVSAWVPGSTVNLLEHENINGSHTISKHVGKSHSALLAEMNRSFGMFGLRIYKRSDGSFTSLAAANKLVSSTIGQNSPTVNSWLNDETNDRPLVLNQQFSSPTGLVAYRTGRGNIIKPSKVHFGQGDGVRVVLHKNDSMTHGFNVHTSFPTKR